MPRGARVTRACMYFNGAVLLLREEDAEKGDAGPEGGMREMRFSSDQAIKM